QFAHAASHDLKEPIRKVHFFIDRLKTRLEGKLSDEDQHMMERVETATDRMRLLVDDLLNYSHVRRGQLELEDVDLNKKVNLIMGDLELMITEKNARISVAPLPVLKGYRLQLQQLFQNLISNALKYNKPGVPPAIEITASTVTGSDSGISVVPEDVQKTFHLIEVKDNGIGFEQQYAERIFNIFTRLHGNLEYAGTGVGLAIVKKVIENHNGYISAQSEPGKALRSNFCYPLSSRMEGVQRSLSTTRFAITRYSSSVFGLVKKSTTPIFWYLSLSDADCCVDRTMTGISLYSGMIERSLMNAVPMMSGR
ncbi:MAG: hypothetical protein EON99_00405, partial [Chitinophagaceae bacterium]